MLPEPIRVTLKVIKAFDALGIPYLIGGSLASALYGIIRATMDADLVADVKEEHIPKLVDILKGEFYIDEAMILASLQHSISFNLIHLESMFKIDVFPLKARAFDQIQMRRRVPRTVGDQNEESAYFSTAEDIILAKLEWFRAGGETSERQWRDVLGVIRLQASRLDFPYLHEWAEQLGVQDLLHKALSSTGG